MADRYGYELFIAGLERADAGGGEGELLITTRREQLFQYQTRWTGSHLNPGSKPIDITFDPNEEIEIVGGVFVCTEGDNIVRFVQMRSIARGIPPLDWRITCQEIVLYLMIDPASNVFVTITPENE